MLLRNARVGDALVDIRVADGTIEQLGTELTGDGTDLEGAYVIPGLWDEHVHFSQWALGRARLDVSAAESARATAALVAAAIGAEQSLVGVGFRDGLWPDEPNLADLDAAAGARPVVLLSGDLHSVWLNSAALALYGHAHHPTGLLREEAAFDVARRITDLPNEQLDGLAMEAGRAAAERGVVGFVDMEMDWNLDNWQRRRAAGFDTQRVEFGIYRQHLDRALELGLRTGMTVDELISVGRFKVLTDGSLNTRTAWCHDPYLGTDEHGLLEVPFDDLVELMSRAWSGGIESAVHAIGDAANALALDAFAATGAKGRIEHAQLIATADIERFAALGVTASVQPEHAMDDRDVADHYWSDRTSRSYPFRTMLDRGVLLAFGSDAPVAPLDPWIAIAAAVGRDRGGRQPWHPEQCVSPTEALTASTRSRVAVGQPADLVAVGRNPITATSGELRDMPVYMTMVAGRITHS
jgi:predicted amidohydrolase YtcJ